jgi:hypothetical protein
MPVITDFSRRNFIRHAAAVPLLNQIAARSVFASAASVFEKSRHENVYSRLGVKTVINCRRTWTYLSGSLEFPEVQAAQREASEYFVNMFELQHAASRRLAELTGAEAGMVTSGAAGAMASATAACMAGSDSKHIWQLPDTTGLKHWNSELLCDSVLFVQVIAEMGGINHRRVVIDSGGQVFRCIRQDKFGPCQSNRIVKGASPSHHDDFMLLDDATGIPPIDNIKLYAKMGLDMYAFTGGKGLRGPQCSGLLLGRKDLIEAAMLSTSPWEGSGAMNVGKDEIIGLLTAVETWLKNDLNALNREWNAHVERMPHSSKPCRESRPTFLFQRTGTGTLHYTSLGIKKSGDIP